MIDRSSKLMKRFEEEMHWTLEQAKKARTDGVFILAYIEWLEELLTWKPVTMKPREKGVYACYCKSVYGEEKEYLYNYHAHIYYNGEKWCDRLSEEIEYFLDIPVDKIPFPETPKEK